jgi:hypothetical protein
MVLTVVLVISGEPGGLGSPEGAFARQFRLISSGLSLDVRGWSVNDAALLSRHRFDVRRSDWGRHHLDRDRGRQGVPGASAA